MKLVRVRVKAVLEATIAVEGNAQDAERLALTKTLKNQVQWEMQHIDPESVRVLSTQDVSEPVPSISVEIGPDDFQEVTQPLRTLP